MQTVMLDVISTVYGMLLRRLATSPASNGAQPELTVRGLRCGGEGVRSRRTPAPVIGGRMNLLLYI